jgi:hypothetical protein
MIVMASSEAVYTVWGVSLALGAVVIVVVALLLAWITRAAGEIKDTTGDIWTVGQRIANNTVHIPLLGTTNRLVTGILVHAAGIDQAAAAIEAHAADCPG